MGNLPLDNDVLEYGSESALWCWEIKDLKLMLVKARNILSTWKSIRRKIHEKITTIYFALLHAVQLYPEISDRQHHSLSHSSKVVVTLAIEKGSHAAKKGRCPRRKLRAMREN